MSELILRYQIQIHNSANLEQLYLVDCASPVRYVNCQRFAVIPYKRLFICILCKRFRSNFGILGQPSALSLATRRMAAASYDRPFHVPPCVSYLKFQLEYKKRRKQDTGR